MYQAAHEEPSTASPTSAATPSSSPPQSPPDPLPDAVFYRGPHPTPDADALRAADAALALLRRVTPRTVVLFLISQEPLP